MRASALILLGLMAGPRVGVAQCQDSIPARGPDALGFIVKHGDALQFFHWASSRWHDGWWAIDSRQQVTYTDTLGAVVHPTLMSPRLEWDLVPWVVYEVAEEYGDSGFWPFLPLGYFVTVDCGHAPYVDEDSPLTNEEWIEILSTSAPAPPPEEVIAVRTWRASLDSVSSLAFKIRTSGEGGGCREVLGLLTEETSEPVTVSTQSGTCSAPGRPYALVRRGGRYFVLFGFVGAEGVAAELWELVEGLPQLIEFEPSSPQIGDPNAN